MGFRALGLPIRFERQLRLGSRGRPGFRGLALLPFDEGLVAPEHGFERFVDDLIAGAVDELAIEFQVREHGAAQADGGLLLSVFWCLAITDDMTRSLAGSNCSP